MRNIRMDIEYEGTHYHGWQIQAEDRTICGVLEEALSKVLQHPVRLNGAGRTDTGVHALGQVANFLTERQIPEENLQRALNSLLPRDIVVRAVTEVPGDFDARRSAMERAYRYQCYVGKHPSGLYRNLTLYIRRPLDLESMRRAAEAFVGTHDFSAFRSKHCDAENPIRTLHSFMVQEASPFVFLDVVSNAFLRNQVRILASTVLEVGLGRIQPEDIGDIIGSQDRRRAGPTLPAKGLVLLSVRYPGEPSMRGWKPSLLG